MNWPNNIPYLVEQLFMKYTFIGGEGGGGGGGGATRTKKILSRLKFKIQID